MLFKWQKLCSQRKILNLCCLKLLLLKKMNSRRHLNQQLNKFNWHHNNFTRIYWEWLNFYHRISSLPSNCNKTLLWLCKIKTLFRYSWSKEFWSLGLWSMWYSKVKSMLKKNRFNRSLNYWKKFWCRKSSKVSLLSLNLWENSLFWVFCKLNYKLSTHLVLQAKYWSLLWKPHIRKNTHNY